MTLAVRFRGRRQEILPGPGGAPDHPDSAAGARPAQIASDSRTGAARLLRVSAARRSRWAWSSGKESARQPTDEPAVIGTAAHTVPTAYSWRSSMGTVAGWASSRVAAAGRW